MGELIDPRAFALGMIALINPCGFALLPAYLGFFLGLDENDEGESRIRALNRAQVVGLSMSVGFLVVFGVLGIIFAGAIGSISSILRFITLGMGIALVILGVAMLFGFQPLLKLPKLEKGTGSRSAGSMFLFGMSYAIASLSCTIGLFLSAVPSTGPNSGFLDRFGAFISYGLGMGLLATVLTLAVAFGKKGIVGNMRSLLPRINLISAVILVVVGAYVALYGYWQIELFDNFERFQERTADGWWVDDIVSVVEGWQQDLSTWVDGLSTEFGVAFVAINLALVAAGMLERRVRRTRQLAA